MAILDTLGVASIFPFIAVLSDPSLIQSNFILQKIYSYLSFDNETEYLIFLGCISLFLLIISLSFKAVTTYWSFRFAMMKEYWITKKLFSTYLYQPYAWFLNKNSSELNKLMLSEVTAVVQGGLLQFVLGISQIIMVIAIILMLALVNLKVTLSIFIFVLCCYLIVYLLTGPFLRKIGEQKVISNEKRFSVANEGFGAIKEVKAYNLEPVFIAKFGFAAKSYALNLSKAHAINQLPRYLMEGLAFGSLLLIILYKILQDNSLGDFLPIISLYALAGYRLMPAAHQIYNSISQINFHSKAISDLYEDLENLNKKNSFEDRSKGIKFNKKINLEKISFSYPNSKTFSIDKVDLDIDLGTKVGIVGKTGSGKSTLAHIILGLISPCSGKIKLDGTLLEEHNIDGYRELIGYVPQDIFIMDDTILANITLGVDHEDVDIKKVEKVARIANIHDFIISSSPDGYKATTGEKGVRLSGGEKQRIGIARALYRDPKILILDEATSALDSITEKLVMDSINKLNRSHLTIIMVAHRLNTLKVFDRIILLNKGKIVNQGKYNELVKDNDILSFGTT